MKLLPKLFFLPVCLLAPLYVSADWIPTNFGVGADSEVRESNPTQNRGTSTELGTRIRNDFIAGGQDDGNDRNSVIYTKFDLTGAFHPVNLTAAFRMTYRNNNLTGNRIQDTVTPNPSIRTGLAVYGLNPTLGSWSESLITYINAPGITFDSAQRNRPRCSRTTTTRVPGISATSPRRTTAPAHFLPRSVYSMPP